MKNKDLLIFFVFIWILMFPVQTMLGQNWPQWRGPMCTGEAPAGNPPIEWSEQKNVLWKIQLSGTGESTPAVWGDSIFITAAQNTAGDEVKGGIVTAIKPVKFLLIALDRQTGKVKWERVAREEIPQQTRNNMGTWANASPVTDGQHVYAFFGSHGLYCYNFDGELLWEKDFGAMDTQGDMGEGASPALYKDKLIVQWDHLGEDFITVLDASSGREIWKKKRDERISWSTPIIVEDENRVQVIAIAEEWIQSYDLEGGEVLWKIAGIKYGNISTPVAADGVVYMGSGLQSGWISAIRLSGAQGDITGSPSILWTYEKFYPYVPSPLLIDGLLYFTKGEAGFLTCLDTATGEAKYENTRLSGINHIFASPSGAGDKIYFQGRDGVVVVIRSGPEFQILATNRLDDQFDASPAIVGDEILLRGHKYLYCISGSKDTNPY